MSIPIIDQLRPLGNFPAVDASDVQAGNQRLSTVLSNTPTTTYVDSVVEGKVDKVDGKGLSTNDFTNAYKTKLDGLDAALAAKANTSDVTSGLAGKVDKETGKGLSANDYTTTEKNKLSGIEAQANKTVISSSLPATPTDQTVPSVKLTETLYKNRFTTPELYGAVGDGVTDDTIAVQAALNSGYDVLLSHLYKITETVNISVDNINVYGFGTIKLCYDHNDTANIKKAVNITSANVNINDITITTDFSNNDTESLNVVPLFSANTYGLWFAGAINCTVNNVKFSMFTDGSHINNSRNIKFYGVIGKNIGQEHLVFENSVFCSVEKCDFSWHLGDGVIIKHYSESEPCIFTISDCNFHDGKTGIVQLLTQEAFWCGGGFTANCEGHSTVLNHSQGIVCRNNKFIDVNYGVILANAVNAIIDGNIIKQYRDSNRGYINAFVLGLDYSDINNPDSMAYDDIKIINNTILQGKYGIRCIDLNTITVKNILIANNNIFNCEKDGIEAHNSKVTGNIVDNCGHIATLANCNAYNNTFKQTTIETLTGDASAEYAVRLLNTVDFKDNIVDTNAYLLISGYGEVCNNALKIKDTITSAWIVVIAPNLTKKIVINQNEITATTAIPYYPQREDNIIFNNKTVKNDIQIIGNTKTMIFKDVALSYQSPSALSGEIDYSACGFTGIPVIIAQLKNIGYADSRYYDSSVSIAGTSTVRAHIRFYTTVVELNSEDSLVADVMVTGV